MTLLPPNPLPNRPANYDRGALASAFKRFNALVPEAFTSFYASHYETSTYWRAGYWDMPVGDIYSTLQMQLSHEYAGDWRGEFMPFTYAGYGYMAFDLQADRDNPPVVFLDNEEAREDDDSDPGFIYPVAGNFEQFLELLNVWARPNSLAGVSPRLGQMPFHHIDVATPELFKRIRGMILRSGAIVDGPEIPYLLNKCGEGLPLRLTMMHNWELLAPSVGERFIPFMAGKDGWLALDYTQIKNSSYKNATREQDKAPVILIRGENGTPTGEPEPFAESAEVAFGRYLPGPISGSIHRLEGFS